MKEFKYTIKDALGIHARPAGLLVKEAAKFTSNIKLKCEDKEVDAKRLLAVMSLGVKRGKEVTITVDGEDEEAAVNALEVFLTTNL